MMNIEREKAKKILFEGRVFTAALLQVDTDHGEAEREIVYHNGGSCVLALNDKNEIALVRQYRIAVKRFLYELPAGKLEAGEEPETCARRELLEEVGWEAGEMKHLALIHPTPGYSSEPINIYWTRDITVKEQNLDEGEELEVCIMPFSEALDRVLKGEITDGKTVTGILKAHALMLDERQQDK